MGIEPTAQAWEAWVLPLYDARRGAIVDRGSPGIKRLGVELHREIQIPEVAAMPVITPENKPTSADFRALLQLAGPHRECWAFCLADTWQQSGDGRCDVLTKDLRHSFVYGPRFRQIGEVRCCNTGR
jgi:hypothetical protein